jgi:hypothetical protein
VPGDPAEEVCVHFNDYYDSDVRNGNFGDGLTCVGVQFNRVAREKKPWLGYPTVQPPQAPAQYWQDSYFYPGLEEITLYATGAQSGPYAINFDAVSSPAIDLVLRSPYSGSTYVFLDVTEFTPGRIRSLRTTGTSPTGNLRISSSNHSLWSWPSRDITIEGSWNLYDTDLNRFDYSKIDQFTLPFYYFDTFPEAGEKLGQHVPNLTLTGVNILRITGASFTAQGVTISSRNSAGTTNLHQAFPRPGSSWYRGCGKSWRGPVPALPVRYLALIFEIYVKHCRPITCYHTY